MESSNVISARSSAGAQPLARFQAPALGVSIQATVFCPIARAPAHQVPWLPPISHTARVVGARYKTHRALYLARTLSRAPASSPRVLALLLVPFCIPAQAASTTNAACSRRARATPASQAGLPSPWTSTTPPVSARKFSIMAVIFNVQHALLRVMGQPLASSPPRARIASTLVMVSCPSVCAMARIKSSVMCPH